MRNTAWTRINKKGTIGQSSSMTYIVFVYGTLLSNEPNNHLLARARLLGRACTLAGFELVDLGPYPAMVRGGRTSVIGELYEVDGKTLARLDYLEGVPDYYQRELIELEGGGQALGYLMEPRKVRGLPKIDSGSWLERFTMEEEQCGFGY